MLTLLGGAPRAGKGIVSRRLVERSGASLLSLDVLKMGLHHAVPSLGINPSAPSDVVGEQMWPLVREMALNAFETGVETLFEGDMLLPRHVAQLHQRCGANVLSCFLGYPTVDPAGKLAQIRQHSGHANDWLNEHADEEVMDLVRYGITYSRMLREECASLGMRFFDNSVNFEGTLVEVEEFLSPSG